MGKIFVLLRAPEGGCARCARNRACGFRRSRKPPVPDDLVWAGLVVFGLVLLFLVV